MLSICSYLLEYELYCMNGFQIQTFAFRQKRKKEMDTFQQNELEYVAAISILYIVDISGTCLMSLPGTQNTWKETTIKQLI